MPSKTTRLGGAAKLKGNPLVLGVYEVMRWESNFELY